MPDPPTGRNAGHPYGPANRKKDDKDDKTRPRFSIEGAQYLNHYELFSQDESQPQNYDENDLNSQKELQEKVRAAVDDANRAESEQDDYRVTFGDIVDPADLYPEDADEAEQAEYQISSCTRLRRHHEH